MARVCRIIPLELLVLAVLVALVAAGEAIYSNVAGFQMARQELSNKLPHHHESLPGPPYRPCQVDDRGYVTVWCLG